jgi:hypothetical protein
MYTSVFIALLVQLVERRFPKPNVGGSSPSGRVYIYTFLICKIVVLFVRVVTLGEVAEWLKASDC